MQPTDSNTIRASVVISFYKNIPNLELLLLALDKQTAKGLFEVIVSEDDDAKETIDFLSKIKPTLSFSVRHTSQPDNGFRKCRALNTAIKACQADFIIFLDGDCIPHKKLVEEYIRANQNGRILYGRRVMLSKKISNQLLSEKNLAILNFFNLVHSGCKRVEEGLYLRFFPQRFKRKTSGILLGCNMGIPKKELLAINGFDEDYIAPGAGEDSDIGWRLNALGAIFFSMKFRSIVYHIYHQERYTKEMDLKNQKILEEKMKQGFFFCKNGLVKNQS